MIDCNPFEDCDNTDDDLQVDGHCNDDDDDEINDANTGDIDVEANCDNGDDNANDDDV